MGVKKRGQAGQPEQFPVQVEENQTRAWFRGIPPERVGLDGEYDYYGLANRVHWHLCEALGQQLVQALQVSQRGRVIILSGVLPSVELLQQLIQVVASVPGVDTVEDHAVQVKAELLMSA